MMCAGAKAWTTPSLPRKAYLGRRVTITLNFGGTTSSRSERSSPIRTFASPSHPAGISGSMTSSMRSRWAAKPLRGRGARFGLSLAARSSSLRIADRPVSTSSKAKETCSSLTPRRSRSERLPFCVRCKTFMIKVRLAIRSLALFSTASNRAISASATFSRTSFAACSRANARTIAFSASTSSGRSLRGKSMRANRAQKQPLSQSLQQHDSSCRSPVQPVSNGRLTLVGRIFFQSRPARSAINCEWSRRILAADMPGQQKLCSSRVFE